MKSHKRLKKMAQSQTKTQSNLQQNGQHTEINDQSIITQKQQSKPRLKKQYKEKPKNKSSRSKKSKTTTHLNQTIEQGGVKPNQDHSKYCSSQEQKQGDSQAMLFIKQQKLTKRQKKKPKKQIVAKNKFFKQQCFQNQQLQQDQKNSECAQYKLDIQPNLNQEKKSMTKFVKKVESIKRKRGLLPQIQVNQNSISRSYIKNVAKIMKDSINEEENQVQFRLQVPRKNAGSKNEVLDGTLFIKKMINTLTQDQIHNEEKIQQNHEQQKKRPILKAKITRQNYLNTIQNNIKERKSKFISKQDVLNTFSHTTLDELKDKRQKVKEVDSEIIQECSDHTGNKGQLIIETIQNNNKQLKPNSGLIKNNRIESSVKDQQKIRVEKRKELISNFFQEFAEQQGAQSNSIFKKQIVQNQQDLENLISNQVQYNQQNEIQAQLKFRDDQLKDDQKIMKNILEGNFKKKKLKPQIDEQVQDKSARLRYMKKMLAERDSQDQHQVYQLKVATQAIITADQDQNQRLMIQYQKKAQSNIFQFPDEKIRTCLNNEPFVKRSSLLKFNNSSGRISSFCAIKVGHQKTSHINFMHNDNKINKNKNGFIKF